MLRKKIFILSNDCRVTPYLSNLQGIIPVTRCLSGIHNMNIAGRIFLSFHENFKRTEKKVFANAIIALKLYEQRKLSVLSLKKCLPLLYMIRDVLS